MWILFEFKTIFNAVGIKNKHFIFAKLEFVFSGTSHPFADGNKRVGFLAMYVFLGLNGLEIVAEETEVVELMVTIADGSRSEREVAGWLRNHLE